MAIFPRNINSRNRRFAPGASVTHRGASDGTGIGGGLFSNHAATTNPTVNDDSGDGYVVGSDWTNLTTDTAFKCLDNTLGAAVWKDITAGAGSSPAIGLALKVVGVHTTGKTIVIDMTGASYNAYAAIITEDNLIAFTLTTTGTVGDVSNVLPTVCKLTATRVFTCGLSATPATGSISAHLTFSDVAST